MMLMYEEDIGGNDLTQSEIQDVAGTLEVFVGTEGIAANNKTDENLLSPCSENSIMKR